jgi:hypothetical protein
MCILRTVQNSHESAASFCVLSDQTVKAKCNLHQPTEDGILFVPMAQVAAQNGLPMMIPSPWAATLLLYYNYHSMAPPQWLYMDCAIPWLCDMVGL